MWQHRELRGPGTSIADTTMHLNVRHRLYFHECAAERNLGEACLILGR